MQYIMACSLPLMAETMTGMVVVVTAQFNGKVPGGIYDSCHVSNLNGLYLSGANDNKGMRWYTFNTAAGSYSLKWTKMKLR